jgi:hypothetical protein
MKYQNSQNDVLCSKGHKLLKMTCFAQIADFSQNANFTQNAKRAKFGG